MTLVKGRYWQYRIRFAGKPNSYSIGVYPQVSLKEGPELHQVGRKLLESGEDSNAVKLRKTTELRAANENTFGALTNE